MTLTPDTQGPLMLVAVCAALTLFSYVQLAKCSENVSDMLEEFRNFYADIDEPPESRHERLVHIADAIDAATSNKQERAFLIMTAWYESRLARFVDLDLPRCRKGIGGWCDNGRSWSVWQVKDERRDGGRSRAASIALSRYRAALKRCGTIEGAIAGYATGYSCEWNEATGRAAMMRRIEGRL